ncbi:hypothetical protein EGR_11257 [Echinococcus granulosus]|uniref:Uncharacterized protein n=1 Tax=Echinococcus granulosus TaxID=6210 RepID=W6UK51_ECHGR|nr:hypothetical protein EGR_11257 [Echinococcus granulosus]EUB53889.1 hypothetical protein EGR_11257 [Echinococcus granulosus]
MSNLRISSPGKKKDLTVKASHLAASDFASLEKINTRLFTRTGATSMNLSSSKQSFTQTRYGSLMEFDPKIQLMEGKFTDSYNSRRKLISIALKRQLVRNSEWIGKGKTYITDGGSRRTLVYEDHHFMQPDPELLDLGAMDELVEGGDLEMSDFETPSSMGSVSALHFSTSNSGLTDFDMLFDDGSRRYLDCEKETKSMKQK